MIRTRFAPSPTGFLHVGGLRTALYAYLFARHEQLKNGEEAAAFILRIEDTDQARYVEGALESLLKTFETIGLNYDEGPVKIGQNLEQKGKFGPYIQSQRTEIYRKYAQELVEKGAAYHCFCTSERLDEMRAKQTARKLAPMYDRTCLNLSKEEVEEKKAAGQTFVIRQKIPNGQKLQFKDLIRGIVQFNTSTIDDQVLMKSDNFPTYHLANVIDDHLMQITHVIRGEEWLPSTPKHVLLYEAFGWQKPEFAHIPLLLNKDKTKLSKRQGDVSVEDYLNKGFSKEAIINFIALLGWHPGEGAEQEIFSLQELIEKFSLEKVHKAGAIFDIEKLQWFNFQWQKKVFEKKLAEIGTEKRGDLLLDLCQKFIPEKWLTNKELLLKALTTIEEKILRAPQETTQHLSFFFEPKDFPLELILNEKMKVDAAIAKKSLEESLKSLENFNDFNNQDKIKENLIALVEKLGVKNGQLLWPLRVALSGEQFSPGVFEIMWVLGKEESLTRVKKALAKVS